VSKEKQLNMKKQYKWFWMPIVVLALGIISVTMFIWSHYIREQLRIRDIPQDDVLMEMSNEITNFHLLLDEYFAGNISISPDQIKAHQNRIMALSKALLEGGISDEHGFDIKPLKHPIMRAKAERIWSLLIKFNSFFNQRIEHKKTVGMDTESDQQFDRLYSEILDEIQGIKQILMRNMSNNESRSRFLVRVILFIWILIVTIVVIGLWTRERRLRTAEKELRESEEQFRAITENSSDITVVLNEDGVYTYINPSVQRISEFSLQDMLGKNVSEFVHPDDMRFIDNAVQTALRNPGQIITVADFRFRTSGKNTWANLEGLFVAMLDVPGINGIVVNCRDITKRKQAEQALKNALTEVEQLKDRFQAENIYLQDEIKIEHNFEEIISHSKEFEKILRKVEQVAPTNSTVLILGETGTGKELLARAIHNISDRRDRPLVKVDCAALPANLIKSELFGHERGAFTGAHARKIGRFELADGGTVFLDEIGDLPLELQTKLLRVLQEGEFERLGSSQTIMVDVRVIAATNRNLKKIVEAGQFREDLYYRLNVFPIKSPPLRNRKDDIPLLVNHFIKKYSAKIGKKIESIPLNIMESIQAYHWPGNVREFENIIERAVVLTDCSTLQLDGQLDRSSKPPGKSENLPTLKEYEHSFIFKTLEECDWVIQGKHGAAKRLGIAPSTLRDRMKKHGIKKP
jgi:PAS domain S-box-containing protein